MKVLKLSARTLSVLVAATLSAGCGDGLQTSAAHNSAGVPAIAGAFHAFAGVRPPGPAHPSLHKSWVSADARRERRLLFASDSGLDEVDIYSLPGMKLEGQLTGAGFNNPQGMCSDTAGDVYVTETNNTEIDEYSHAGSLLARYPDSIGFPIGCAVDPATGNLAVTDIVNDGSGPGQVLIYSNPSTQPKLVSNPSQYFYYFAGYGPKSSLWVSGMNASGGYMLSRCSASSCSTIGLSGGTVYYPGAVQWDAVHRSWVVFDQRCRDTTAACSYPVSPNGVLGTATTYDSYKGGSDCDLIQGEIATDRRENVVGGDYEYCGAAASTFNRWAYKAGGSPTKYATLSSSYSVPNGVAISTR
ncbi:MAG: hypothetical protein JO113_04705 [Candidatus Eremiobacteraeota bacterium]|nr:hypothetical protein [Candidatus Eremiobacteraeota bacterium]